MARPTSSELPPEILHILRRLRWRIRAYVWLDGLALAIAWLGAMFWLGLAFDYLPVLVGIGEMPRTARLLMLIAVAIVLAWILYRRLLRRVFARLADRSMALLLERRFREFQESLITSVELADDLPESAAAREMLDRTRHDALKHLHEVRIGDVFNLRPLFLSVTFATLVVMAAGGLYVVNASAFELGLNRLYLLEDTLWPRQARIEVVGIEVRGAGASAESAGELVRLRNNQVKAAKGSNLSVLVRADASLPVVPEVCSIQYRTREGDRGRVNMTRVGRVRDGYQFYKYDGKPFDGILSDIQFDVVGFDHRISDQTILVVDSPTIVGIEVACVFPQYMVDEQLSLWMPRSLEYTSGMQLPVGTTLKLRCRANKPLTHVELHNPDAPDTPTDSVSPATTDAQTFDYEIASLGSHATLDVILTDTDEVRSERPYRIHISGVEDAPPLVEMRLAGIGSAVTTNVLLPVEGKITDDYGVARSWVEVMVNDGAPVEFPFESSRGGEARQAIDFRTERSQSNGVTLQAQDKLHVTVRAADKRALGQGPNQAAGDRYQLDVVTDEQLLALLESRELGLRRRFEQIIDEMTQTRDLLTRVRLDGPARGTADQTTPSAPDTDPTTSVEADEPALPAARIWSLRLLRTRQSLMQSQKSAQEVLGVASSFRDIRDELINNRVDTADRKQRLQEQIADPLQRIGEQQFPQLIRQLEKLAELITVIEQRNILESEDPATVAAAQEAVTQADAILRELDAVLQKMLDLESFNELLDLVRALIQDQEQLIDETKKEQKKAVLDLLK